MKERLTYKRENGTFDYICGFNEFEYGGGQEQIVKKEIK